MSIRNYIKKNRRQSSIAYSTICSGATSLNTPQLAAGSFINLENPRIETMGVLNSCEKLLIKSERSISIPASSSVI